MRLLNSVHSNDCLYDITYEASSLTSIKDGTFHVKIL